MDSVLEIVVRRKIILDIVLLKHQISKDLLQVLFLVREIILMMCLPGSRSMQQILQVFTMSFVWMISNSLPSVGLQTMDT